MGCRPTSWGASSKWLLEWRSTVFLKSASPVLCDECTAFYLNETQASRLAEPHKSISHWERPGASGAEDLTQEKQKWFSGVAACSHGVRLCAVLSDAPEPRTAERRLAAGAGKQLQSDDFGSGSTGHSPLGNIEDLAPTPEMGHSFGLGFCGANGCGP